MEHCGMESHPADIHGLVELVRENQFKTAVEVGTWTGATACRLADIGCSVTCIDWFRGTEDPDDQIGHNRDFGTMWSIFQRNVGDRLWRTIFPVVSHTTGAEWIQGPFDIAFIDADHRYENCKADILRWAPTVKRDGYLTGHDYCPRFPGVMQAVDELFPGDFEVRGHSLWVKKM